MADRSERWSPCRPSKHRSVLVEARSGTSKYLVVGREGPLRARVALLPRAVTWIHVLVERGGLTGLPSCPPQHSHAAGSVIGTASQRPCIERQVARGLRPGKNLVNQRQPAAARVDRKALTIPFPPTSLTAYTKWPLASTDQDEDWWFPPPALPASARQRVVSNR